MMLGLLQAALELVRLRWEHRAAEWGLRTMDDRMRRDLGLPPRTWAEPQWLQPDRF